MKTGLSISWSGEAADAVTPSSMGVLPLSHASGAAVPCQYNKREACIITQEVDSQSSSLSLMTLTILPSVHIPITRGTCLKNSDSSGTTRKTTSSSASYESTECTDLGEGVWHWELLHCMDVVSAGADPLTGNITSLHEDWLVYLQSC